MTSYVTFLDLNSACGVELIEHLFKVPLNCNFSERQISAVLLCDQARDFFCSCWASSPNQLSRVVSTRLAVYNSKSSKPNKSANLFRKRLSYIQELFVKSFHPASLMAWSFACCNPCQNPHNSKDKLADGTFTKGNNRRTPTPAAIHASTATVAPVIAPLIVSSSINSSVVRYLENNLQQIVRTIFEARVLLLSALAPVSTSVVAAASYYEGPYERLLKAWFPDIYWGKTHLECYNFFQ